MTSGKACSIRHYKTEKPVKYCLHPHVGLMNAFKKAIAAGTSLENSVYLLKMKFFPMSDDKIFFYLREMEKQP